MFMLNTGCRSRMVVKTGRMLIIEVATFAVSQQASLRARELLDSLPPQYVGFAKRAPCAREKYLDRAYLHYSAESELALLQRAFGAYALFGHEAKLTALLRTTD